MKIKSSILATLVATFLMAGCEEANSNGGNPGGGEDKTTTQIRNEWIYSTLAEWYLWPEDVAAKTPNYKTEDHTTFFQSILSTTREDGRHDAKNNYFYSYIDKQAASTRSFVTSDKSFGFEFEIIGIQDTDGVLCLISYVVKGSPADLQGIKRGHFISHVNGTQMNSTNYKSLYPLLLTESYTNTPLKTATVSGGYFTDPDNVQASFNATLIPAKVIDNPINTYSILNLGGGKKAGYMLYNEFASGEPNITNGDFNNKMKQVFAEFKSAAVTDLILDFRFNGGGLTRCVQLMTSMVNNSTAGSTLIRYKHNTKITNSKYGGSDPVDKVLTIEQMKGSAVLGDVAGVNLGMTRVFVITTQLTASSSELVIATLKGIGVEVIQIGEVTEGKRVGMSILPSKTFGGFSYSIEPVSCYVFNSIGESASTPRTGWVPNFAVSRSTYFNGGLLYQFGDSRDPLVGAATNYIKTGSFLPLSKSTTKVGRQLELRRIDGEIISSVQLKKTIGMYVIE